MRHNWKLLTIHLILSFTTTVGGMDTMQILPCVMEHAFGFLPLKTNGAAYSTTIFLNGFLAGMRSCLSLTAMVIPSFYHLKYVFAWLSPALLWSAFVYVLVFVMRCINALVRKNWIEQSKLSFPIIQLPLEMTRANCSPFKNRLIWIGIAISGGIALINGCTAYIR